MAGRAKFACSIEPSLLARVERLRARTGESRSALVSRALRSLAEDDARAERVRRYVAAYRERPEAGEEIAVAARLARRAARHLAWEDD